MFVRSWKFFYFSTALLFFLFLLIIYKSTTHVLLDSYYSKHRSIQPLKHTDSMDIFNGSCDFWKIADFEKQDIPDDVKEKSDSTRIMSNTIFIEGDKIHFLTSLPSEDSDVSIVLLHGQSFSAQTWANIHTIQMCSAFGFRTIAVDLPGFGKSPPSQHLTEKNFLHKFFTILDLKRPVIISPSMSGVFSLPYVIKHWQNMSGFVPVSPSGTKILEASLPCGKKQSHLLMLDKTCLSWAKQTGYQLDQDLSCIKVPTMVVCGQYDKKISSAALCHFPDSRGIEISKGKHAAYMSNPELWHTLLYNFMLTIEKSRNCI